MYFQFYLKTIDYLMLMFVLKYTESLNVQISKGQVFGNCELLLGYFYEKYRTTNMLVNPHAATHNNCRLLSHMLMFSGLYC